MTLETGVAIGSPGIAFVERRLARLSRCRTLQFVPNASAFAVVNFPDNLRHWSIARALCLALAPTIAAAAPQLSAPAEVRALLSAHLKLEEGGSLVDAPARAAYERRLRREVADLLATEGYFSPRVTLVDGDDGLRLVVAPGARSLIGSVSIELRGDIDAARRTALLAGWKLKSGAPFRQADWDDAKQSLLRGLLAVEHAAAQQVESQAEVDVEARRVDLQLVLDAGPRYRFGELKIVGLSRYASDLVLRYNQSVRPGEPYREENLLALQSALQNTPYFASVSVDLERSAAGDALGAEVSSEAVAEAGNKTPGPERIIIAPVRIGVRERAPHYLQLGAGMSSNTGARVEASYRSTDLFRWAWELNTGVRIEQLRQAAYADIFLPPDVREIRDSVGVLLENSEIQGLGIERVAFGGIRVQRNGSVEQRLGVNWQEEKQSPKDALATINRALTAQAGWVWRHADDPLDPAAGMSLQLQVGGGAKALLSDRNFVRSYLRYQRGVPLGPRDAILLRGEVGATLARSRQGIPQDFLFRAGGSNSVRGYAYQSLGVKEGSAIVGGRYLLTLSAEYTHWLDASWGVATFVDAGEAGDDRQAFKLARAVGLGGRWRSPAGPLAIDLAWGQREHKLRLHFSLAVPF